MTFEQYWKQLVHRVYHDREPLVGIEEKLYRLTCICAETMVDGIEAYFERRWDQYPQDQAALIDAGFPHVAADFAAARQAMFGDQPLTKEFVEQVVDDLLDNDSPATARTLAALAPIYDRLIAQSGPVMLYRYELGLAHGLYDG